MMDEAMKLTGLTYLQQTLRPIIELILSEKKPCEIDPTRNKEQGTIETNLTNLKEYVDKIFIAITQSFINCPAIMCRLFDALRQCAAQKFPTDHGVRYSVVSGFIFLRFFAPAILGPRLFDLTTKPIVSFLYNVLKVTCDF
jgi:Ras GTPase-activating protein 3